MLFNTLSITAVGVLSLHVSGAIAQPHEPRGLDVQLKWHEKTNCDDKGGPKRDYSDGACLDLAESTRGVEILDLSGSCHLISYDDSSCQSGSRILDSLGCWNLKGKNSVQFKCD
ncbi:hypothetical protein P168DRAFT_322411 [Aspergillus campestris IBT 28561]|uniref:Cyanovirin-N domain-containing protein n=1 Tax=Aspergillus campestris (strain IBT 28561) TaxID=1392248 RepID=A0A2I1CRU5_ASPC2|nr:uncharacterized protein P168DRAFT_322411 [Aspergillus campestris IBT 28561]PKY00354.1 hypothetical protein P168DRAFT_322411 [Aspergillus campestris IBT 28561]